MRLSLLFTSILLAEAVDFGVAMQLRSPYDCGLATREPGMTLENVLTGPLDTEMDS